MISPKVSVILPIYNGEKTLASTLDSIVNQTFQNFEVIACIDGTNDNSEKILESYRAKINNLLIIKNNVNLGLGPTMNRLFAHAKGEYVAVAEQDDYYYKDRLYLQVEILDAKSNVGIVSGISDFWDGNKITMKFPGLLVSGGQYPEGKELFLLNYRNQIKVVNSCMMIRKATHLSNGLYFSKHYPSISVDWSYVLRFSLIADIHGIHQSLVRLDRRTDRESVTTHKTKQFLAARELIRSFKYEYPTVISNEDYKYAMRTQNLMEMNAKSRISYIIAFLKYVIVFPAEKRYYTSFNSRIFKKVKKKLFKKS